MSWCHSWALAREVGGNLAKSNLGQVASTLSRRRPTDHARHLPARHLPTWPDTYLPDTYTYPPTWPDTDLPDTYTYPPTWPDTDLPDTYTYPPTWPDTYLPDTYTYPPTWPDTYLPVEGDSIRLTLGTDAAWPRRMFLTSRPNLTADVLQVSKLPSVNAYWTCSTINLHIIFDKQSHSNITVCCTKY